MKITFESIKLIVYLNFVLCEQPTNFRQIHTVIIMADLKSLTLQERLSQRWILLQKMGSKGTPQALGFCI